MYVLQHSQALKVDGGIATMQGQDFTVTGSSVIYFGGLEFLSSAICNSTLCTDSVFTTPATVTFTNKYNGKNKYSISGEYIEDGAIYHLS